jgi:hypothetical protein
MSARVSDSAIFSLASTPPTSAAANPARLYFPYEDAWKEYDKLYAAAQGRGEAGYVSWGLENICFATAALDPYLSKKLKLLLILAWFLTSTLRLLSLYRARRRFPHWSCPRCGSEWPGTRTEKDRACKSCGLHLYQFEP